LVVVIVVAVVLLCILIRLVPVGIEAVFTLIEFEVIEVVLAVTIGMVDNRLNFMDLSGLDVVDILVVRMFIVTASVFLVSIVMRLVVSSFLGIMILMALSSSLACTVFVVGMSTFSMGMAVTVLVAIGSFPLTVVAMGMVIYGVRVALIGMGRVGLLEFVVPVGLLEDIFVNVILILMSVHFVVFHISVISITVVSVSTDMSLVGALFVGSRSSIVGERVVELVVFGFAGLIDSIVSISIVITIWLLGIVAVVLVSLVNVVFNLAILATVTALLGSTNFVGISIALAVGIVVHNSLLVIRVMVDNMSILDNVVLGGCVVFLVVIVVASLGMGRFVVLESISFLIMHSLVEVMLG